MFVHPDGTPANDWRRVGWVTWTEGKPGGEMAGLWYSSYPDSYGQVIGTGSGNVQSGSTDFVTGSNALIVQGAFSGNTYTGRYLAAGAQFGAGAQGDFKMTRR